VRRPTVFLSALALVASLATMTAPPAAAAASTFYVDGKTGSDGNDGRSPSSAFKTIAKAAAAIPSGSAAAGWVVEVKGYSDYIYRERPIPPGWDRHGAAGAPIVFRASGYATGSFAKYVKPIVSGADVAPRSGEAWVPSGTADVWKTPWPTKPFGYGQYSGSLRTALFQDRAKWLWEQSSLSLLANRAKQGLGGYVWSGGYLYASGIGSRDPGDHTIDVVMRNAFLFLGTNGVSRVQVRGFEVRHAANGIAFMKGVDNSTAADNVLVGNLLMGIVTSGAQTSSGPNPASGLTVWRNRGYNNTLQAIKIDEGTKDSSFCDNIAARNGLQGIKVQGPPGGTGYTGTTTGILICRSSLYGNDYNPTGSTYNNGSGLTIANGAQKVTVDQNLIYDNDVGVHITQESSGRAAMNGIAIKRNQIHDNRRFGINFYDGAKGSSGGAGSMRSDYDLLWDNGIGIMVSFASKNKSISHATIHNSVAEGLKVGDANKTAATVAVTSSLFTSNGGYGVWLVTGSSLKLSYSGLSGNSLGATKGSISKTSVNTKPPDYLSTTTGTNHLRISTSSYQYTAGYQRRPIGARY
jgi:Right handed beta helix region